MRWSRFLHRARRDAELAKDIQFYLDAETEDNLGRGMAPGEARALARRKLGNTTLIREEVYGMNGPGLTDTLWQDAVYGLRQLRRSPGFTAVAAITLALGIGTNVAIFSVVNGVLLRPLPYKDPGRLMWVGERFNQRAALAPDFIAWRGQNHTFQQIEGYSPVGPGTNLSGLLAEAGPSEPIPVRLTEVTVGFFPMLGLQPLLGRTFTSDEGEDGRNHVLLLSEKLWRSQFAAGAGVAGTTVRLNNSPYTIVGVMPALAEYTDADVWTPADLNSPLFAASARPMRLIDAIGRLKPGVTLSQAESNLAQITHRIDQDYPSWLAQSRDRQTELAPLHTLLAGNVRPLLLILLGTVSFVLWIACANVANLSLSRAAGRAREFAIRGALGAGRGRLIRQLLTESLLLAIFASAIGFLCGLWSVHFLKNLIPPTFPAEIGLDPRILAFAIGITILATLIFGLAPAVAASRTQVNETLKAGGARTGPGARTHRFRNALVVCEIALSLVLLIGAGLLTRSFLRLTNVRLGFNPEHVLTAQIWKPFTNGMQTPSPAPFFNAALGQMRAIPGVKSAAASSRVPLSPCPVGTVKLRGASNDLAGICTNNISTDYFQTMEIPLLKGRSFTDQDSSGAAPVVMINQALAHEVIEVRGEGRDPLGQQIGIYTPGGVVWCTLVGVTANTRNGALEQEPLPELFVPYSQTVLPMFATFVLRTETDPAALAGSVRKAVEAVDKDQSLSNIQPFADVIDASTSPQWFRTLLLGLFAVLAVALAAVGVFGVMAYTVSQRTHEIGVRVALGAQPGDILSLALGQGMVVAAIGLVIGIAGAAGLTRLLSGFLYDVKPTDLTTFAAAVVLLTGTALLACYIPARRAARVDPVIALRNE
jgi:predicted permease